MVVVSTVLRISDPVVDSVCSIALTTDPFSTKKKRHIMSLFIICDG